MKDWNLKKLKRESEENVQKKENSVVGLEGRSKKAEVCDLNVQKPEGENSLQKCWERRGKVAEIRDK